MGKESTYIKGTDLRIGMTVQRFSNGVEMSHPMIVYASGPYYRNPLYADEDFKVIQHADIATTVSK